MLPLRLILVILCPGHPTEMQLNINFSFRSTKCELKQVLFDFYLPSTTSSGWRRFYVLRMVFS